MTPPRSRRIPTALPGGRAPAFVRERAALEGSPLSRMKDNLAARGLSPRKRFGQNFLIQESVAARIVELCHLRDDDVAIEIGPGTGAITGLIASRVRHLIAVEKDDGLAQLLTEEMAELPRVEIVNADFLEFDLAAVAAAHDVDRLVVVGNIPYNITTPILERIFENARSVRTAVFLVQKEYAQRLAAAPGTPEYGSLTLFARYHALLEPLMNVRASAFWPRPEVDSMLVRFFLREHPPVDVPSEEMLFRIIRGSFQMRRKQLLNTLEESIPMPKDEVLKLGRHAGIDVRRRGETLSLDEFAKLARAVSERQGNTETA